MSVPAEELPQVSSTPAPDTPGAVLAEARKAMRLEQIDIAKQLKLSLAQVNALESDAYEQLPGPVFVRGFIRNYARFVRIDAESLIARLPGTPATEVREVNTVDEMPVPGESTPWRRYAIAAAVVIVVLAVYEFVFTSDTTDSGEPPTAQSPAPATDSPPSGAAPAQGALAPETVPPAAVVPAASAPAASAPAPVSGVAQTTAPAPVAAPVPTPSGAVVTVSASAPTPVLQTVPAAAPATMVAGVPAAPGMAPGATPALVPASTQRRSGESVLRMTFERDCWVEVRDRNGKIVYSQLNRGGSEQQVFGAAPLSMTLGNARGVRLSYNDRPVDLTPHIKVDVARLTLP